MIVWTLGLTNIRLPLANVPILSWKHICQGSSPFRIQQALHRYDVLLISQLPRRLPPQLLTQLQPQSPVLYKPFLSHQLQTAASVTNTVTTATSCLIAPNTVFSITRRGQGNCGWCRVWVELHLCRPSYCNNCPALEFRCVSRTTPKAATWDATTTLAAVKCKFQRKRLKSGLWRCSTWKHRSKGSTCLNLQTRPTRVGHLESSGSTRGYMLYLTLSIHLCTHSPLSVLALVH